MKIILFLLTLFAIGCVLYGISAGVQAIGRGLSQLADAASDDDTRTALRHQPAQVSATGAVPIQSSIAELRDIFALYQQGALTQEEFEAMKQRLLNSINTAAPQKH
mgnify:FL=1